jgi:hypothetical protein
MGVARKVILLISMTLGRGKSLFLEDIPKLHLELITTKNYQSGLVQLHYKKPS